MSLFSDEPVYMMGTKSQIAKNSELCLKGWIRARKQMDRLKKRYRFWFLKKRTRMRMLTLRSKFNSMYHAEKAWTRGLCQILDHEALGNAFRGEL